MIGKLHLLGDIELDDGTVRGAVVTMEEPEDMRRLAHLLDERVAIVAVPHIDPAAFRAAMAAGSLSVGYGPLSTEQAIQVEAIAAKLHGEELVIADDIGLDDQPRVDSNLRLRRNPNGSFSLLSIEPPNLSLDDAMGSAIDKLEDQLVAQGKLEAPQQGRELVG